MDLSFFLTNVAVAISSVVLFRKLFPQDSKENHSSTSSPPSSLSPSSSLSPPASLSRNRKHHVFPSFHGKDVRKNLLSHILKEFRSKGIDSFIDNNMERCKQIGPELIEAIRGSKIAIVLLSKNYASSTWCMNELVEIMTCRKVLGQTVMTIFYEVDPTDVKKQTGDFGKVFKKTCKGKSKDDIGRWKHALAEVATIAGEHSSNWVDDAAMIEKIAIQISNKLNIAAPPHDFDRLIGMKAHMKRMKPLLCLNSDDVRMIGIWGPPGIGKRTIARFLFHEHCSSFQLSAIMVNIRASYPRACLDEYSAQLKLQKRMLSHIFNQKDIVVPCLEVAQERLQDKKVLLVLGDVNQLEQLDALAKETGWFGPGSRIIITTEDLRVLKAHGITHIYKVSFPSIDEALQIFCMNAFDQKYPKDGFEELAREVTYLTGNLPLGLKVMGSHFKGMTKHQWSMELPRLKNNLNEKIESILKFSYDALCDEDKNLFLHIACFFRDEPINQVEEFLEKKFSNVKQGLNVLADKSLISTIIEHSKWIIKMHNLLSQLGRDIVRHEPMYKSILEPGQRQFLLDTEEICDLLIDDAAGSRSVIGIDFDFGGMKKKLNISERAFKGMYNLQFLRFRGDDEIESFGFRLHDRDKLKLSSCLNNLSRKLLLLHWDHFPMKCLPSNVNLEFLVELNMQYSKLEKLWEENKPLRNLRRMNLCDSVNLKELPDFSTAIKLSELNLKGCSSLTKLPSSIGEITNLKRLYLERCSSLVELPSSIGNVTNLEVLDLNYCSSLVELPFSVRNLHKLRNLWLKRCSKIKVVQININLESLVSFDLSYCSSMAKIPSTLWIATNLEALILDGCSSPPSIENLHKLGLLSLDRCSNIEALLSTIGNATSLKILSLQRCSSLVELPSSIGNLHQLFTLNLEGCSSLLELPSSIGNLHQLHILNLKGCSNLVELPININLKSLSTLDLTDCSLLKSFPEISTSISHLMLVGTSIEEVPLSIRSWSNLCELRMSYSENLKEFPHGFDRITELHLSDKGIQEIGPWVEGISSLWRLNLSGCRKVISLPQLPDSLRIIDAEICESLERIDCSFRNPDICLNFAKCFKLNQEARDLIIQTSTWPAILPGEEVPACFTLRASGSSLTVKLNERPLPTSTKFKACILVDDVKLSNLSDDDWEEGWVDCSIMSKQNALIYYESISYESSKPLILYPVLTEHLYTFEVEARNVTSTELVFEFNLCTSKFNGTALKIKECGIHQLFEVPS